MLLFTRDNAAKIVRGDKTQTRRVGEKRWNVDALHQVRTSLFGEPVALIRIVSVGREALGDIDDAAARREGYKNRAQFFDAWRRIHGSLELGGLVWVIDFRCVATSRRDDGSWEHAGEKASGSNGKRIA